MENKKWHYSDFILTNTKNKRIETYSGKFHTVIGDDNIISTKPFVIELTYNDDILSLSRIVSGNITYDELDEIIKTLS